MAPDDLRRLIAGGLPFVVLGILCVACLVGLAIQIFICWLLSDSLKRLPPEYRQQQPEMVWLLLIPLFGLVWNFFVYPKIADSYKAYFTAQASGALPMAAPGGIPNLNYQNANTGDDCGRGIGLAYCICAAISWVPYVGACTGLAALVLMIIFLVKITGLKNMLPPANPIGGAPITRV
ncbi:MAG: hypothetical protein WCI73_08045 [Phycisphaerae bacterium]